MELDAHPTFKANGLALDARRGARRLRAGLELRRAASRAAASRELLAFHHGGRYLNSPNDIVVRAADGSDLLHRPRLRPLERLDRPGAQPRARLPRRLPQSRPSRDGEAQLLVAEGEFDQPNGLCFSPDERLLYVNDSDHGHIKAFDVAADGTLGPARDLRRRDRHRLQRRGLRRDPGGPATRSSTTRARSTA